MRDDLNPNDREFADEGPPSGLVRLGGVLILLGTGLSMALPGWQADAAMGAALLGLVLVLAGRRKPSGR